MPFWDSDDGFVGGWKYLSDPGHIFLDDPKDKQATATAAQGAQGVSAQEQAWAQQQWQRQMEGLQGALGSYAPSQAYWQSTYGQQGPGAMENYWSQNQNKFGQPGAQAGAYNQFQSWMNDPWSNQTQAGDRQAQQYLQGPTSSSSYYQQNGQNLANYSGPTYGRDQFYANQSGYNSPGAGEAFYNANQSKYGNDTRSENAYESAVRQMSNPGYAEDMMKMGLQVADTTGGLALLKHQEYANGPTALQQNEAENKGYIRGANQAGDYYASQRGALSGPGAYEAFVTSDIAGANPLYERTRDRGIATINQEMARRGGFNSGAAVDRIGNYTAELDAQDYQNRATRAQQAQQMQLARIGQGSQVAQGAAGLDIQRGQALGGLDTQNEQAQLGRQGIGIQAEKNASDASLAKAGLQLQAAQAADKAKMDRLMGIDTMANTADTNNLAYLNAGQRASMDAQNAMLARLAGSMGAANSLDQTRLSSDQQALARLLGGYNMAQGSDASNLARAQQIFSQGQGIDASQLQRYQMQMKGAQDLDQYNLANLIADQQRTQAGMQSISDLNNAQAGQYGKFYSEGGELSGQAFTDAMSALMQSYGYDIQGKESAEDRKAQKQAGAMKLLAALFA